MEAHVFIADSETDCDLAGSRLNELAAQQRLFADSISRVETIELSDIASDIAVNATLHANGLHNSDAF